MSRAKDVGFGLAATALGLAWYVQAAGIEDSLLSDAVGAGGVPKVIALVMAGAGALLVLRALLSRPAAEEEDRSLGQHAKAAGLLAMTIAYVVAAPVLGFPIAIGLFAAVVAVYAGARMGATPLAFGAGVAAVFWVSFVKALGIAFPVGAIFGG